MSAPNPNSPVPELDVVRGRAFSFYPPILNIEHNQWELRVHNTKSDVEIWVPRRFIGQVSRVEEPVMIVGLSKELEYSAGLLRPTTRRIIQMPKASPGPAPADEASIPKPAMVSGVRLSSDGDGESRLGLLLIGGIVAALVAVFAVVSFFRADRVEYTAVGYHAVVRKLGPPANDRWREGKDLQYRALSYPNRHLTVILMGIEQDKALYIGAVNDDWRPVHAVNHAGRGNTRSLLEKLPRF
jgi:hypothetical protein